MRPNPAPPAHVYDPAVRANLEAKVRRLAAAFAEREHPGTSAALEVPIGSAPWGATLRAELPVVDGKVDPAAAEAAIADALATWYASLPGPTPPAAPADIPGATADTEEAPAGPAEGA